MESNIIQVQFIHILGSYLRKPRNYSNMETQSIVNVFMAMIDECLTCYMYESTVEVWNYNMINREVNVEDVDDDDGGDDC